MILDFTVENYGPFKDEVVLDFRPSKLSDPEDNIIRSGGHESLDSIVVFGPNASGKSRLLHAMGVMSSLVRFPLPANMPIPFYDPFRLDPRSRRSPTRMRVRFVEDGVLYDYSVSYNSDRIVSEELYHSPNGTRSKVFTRTADSISVTSTPSGKKLSRIKGQTGRNSTFVSVAALFNHDVCLKVNDAMSKVVLLTGEMGDVINTTIKRMNADAGFKSKLVEAMNVADFSISGIDGSVRERHVADMRSVLPKQIIGLMMATGSTRINEMTLNMTHDVIASGLSDADRTFPYVMESNGTIRMLYIMGPVIDALRTGGFLAIDEFASFLDDSICRWIIGLFRSDRNPNGAQLLVNTHDQLLMDTDDLLRRDQVYLVSKDRSTQRSEVRALSEFSIRKDCDPRRWFAQGKLGSRPSILDEGWSDFERPSP